MNNLPTPVNDKLKSLPNGLKKRLISNLVLEAVLDRAMVDFQDRRSSSSIWLMYLDQLTKLNTTDQHT